MSRTKQATESEQLHKPTSRGAASQPTRSPEDQNELEQQFKRDNAEAFASMNVWVEEHGLPLEKYRQF